MKNILFVAYGGGHINIIDLIAKKLIKDQGIQFKILALTTAYNKVIDQYPEGIVKQVSDYKHLFQTDINQIEKYGLELLEENYNPNSGISREDTIMYLGLSMLDLAIQHGEEMAKKLYDQKKRQAFLPVQTMKKILEYENIDIIVSTTSPRFEQASLIAGNELGIETVEILDLFGELYPLPEAKHIICMNKNVESSLKKQGLTDKKYYHLGQPVIEESLKHILQIDKKMIYHKMNIDQNKHTLLYASQIPILHNNDCTYNSRLDYTLINNEIFSLLEKLHDHFEINIVFRLHPNENINDYVAYFQKYNFIRFINHDLNMYESIAIADLIITPYSTLAIEALVANKIVFTYKNDFDSCYPITEMKNKPFIFSDGFSALENNLCTYLNNPKQIEKIKDFFPKNSVENIIELIKEL